MHYSGCRWKVMCPFIIWTFIRENIWGQVDIRGSPEARRGMNMSSQCKSDSRNLQYACLAGHICALVTRRVKLCYLQIPRQQRKRMEYSTVSPNWKGRSRLWKEKTVTDAAENCNTESAFPVSCQLHGMKDMLDNSGVLAVSMNMPREVVE
jgi:hypothetical protein